jgi:hypothetical protein
MESYDIIHWWNLLVFIFIIKSKEFICLDFGSFKRRQNPLFDDFQTRLERIRHLELLLLLLLLLLLFTMNYWIYTNGKDRLSSLPFQLRGEALVPSSSPAGVQTVPTQYKTIQRAVEGEASDGLTLHYITSYHNHRTWGERERERERERLRNNISEKRRNRKKRIHVCKLYEDP